MLFFACKSSHREENLRGGFLFSYGLIHKP